MTRDPEIEEPVWFFDCDIDSEYDEFDGDEVTILDVSRSTLDGDRVFVRFPDGTEDWVGTDEVADAAGKRFEDHIR